MPSKSRPADKELSEALEDYLETILDLIRRKGIARVRDICLERGVKSGSVSPAMARLAELGFINHVRGEYVTLTESGQAVARRTRARHDLLAGFFRDFLGVDPGVADRDACLMEHHLSDETMDGLARLFESVRGCGPGFDPVSVPGLTDAGFARRSRNGDSCTRLPALEPGDSGLVARLETDASRRVRLMDCGLIPGAMVEMNRRHRDGSVQILLNGNRIDMDAADAACVILR